MPPPSYGSKVSTRSTGDHEIDGRTKTDLSSSNDSSSDEESKAGRMRYEGVGIVKSLLGPSFEDAVLRTFEFGKSLIQKTENNQHAKMFKEKKCKKKSVKSEKDAKPCRPQQLYRSAERTHESLMRSNLKKTTEGRFTRKRIVFTAKLDKELPLFKPPNYTQKLSTVAKIRSLDSDLKQLAPSPEKIKRQLEALIQINKDEPPEHAGNPFYFQKAPKFHSEITVMPSLCVCKNEENVDGCSSVEVHSCRKSSECGQSSTSRIRNESDRCNKKRSGVQSGICQAPEFLTSALGPSLDVSIIDNLKMMRNLFKCDSGKGEGGEKQPCQRQAGAATPVSQCPEQMEYRIQELMSRLEELQEKEQCLMRQIEEEEKERECKRKAFEEEEKKLCNMKACLEELVEEEKKKDCGKKRSECDMKYDSLKQKVACEEEKLSRLKDQYDCYKRDIIEAKNRKESLKRNKSLLDAWDVIASRACHTRLPSFSRAYDLERKQLKGGDNLGNIHCCFMPQVNNQGGADADCAKSLGGRRSKSRSRGGSSTNLEICSSKSKEQVKINLQPTNYCPGKREDVPFPIQRDVTCGLHKNLKPCCCSSISKNDALMSNSDDELLKKSGPGRCKEKGICRSRSETTLKKEGCPKIVKVLWAVTRINVFQDNCRTYEVMDATSTPPSCAPVKTEGIFVVKNSQKKNCMASIASSPKRRYGQQH